MRALSRAVALAVAFQAWPALAHDYWMVPSELVVPGEREVSVSLYVGEAFAAEQEKAFERARFTRLAHLHAGKTEDLLGGAVEGAVPMVRLPLKGEGGHLIGGERNLARIEMQPAEFKEYVEHEGLTGVSLSGDSGKPVRERYTRFLKTLVQVGRGRDETFKTVLGTPLELVPEVNPVFLEPGGQLLVSVLYRGRPLAGARVEALSKVGRDVRETGYTTDTAGQILVNVDRRGTWLLRDGPHRPVRGL